jgi:hypothetical protein
VGIGGWAFVPVAATEAGRQRFASSAVNRPWATIRLSRAISRLFALYTKAGPTVKTRIYRHIAIAFGRKFLGLRAKLDQNDESDEEHDWMEEMAGHSTKTGRWPPIAR